MAPRKNVSSAIGSSRHRPAAVRWNSGELFTGLGWGNRWGGPRGHTDAIWAGGRVGAAPAGEVRRRQASAGTEAPALASSRLGQENGRRAWLYWVLGEAPEASVGSGCEGSDGSTAAAHMARWRALRLVRGGTAAA
jgi:hypothetical protein